MKKVFIVILLLLLVIFISKSQNFKVRNIDVSRYPIITGDLVQSGTKLKLIDTNNLVFKSSEKSLEINSIDCEKNSISKSLSSTLVLDVSGSMYDLGNMEKAKSAAIAWVNQLDKINYNYECSIISFNHYSTVLQDFTNSNYSLNYAIGRLYPNGGTSYYEAFLNPLNGALINMAGAKKEKKIIVFLTDGLANINDDLVIEKAKKDNIIIHCLTIGNIESVELKRIAELTGGVYKTNINSISEAEKVFNDILDNETEKEQVCKFTLEALKTCDNNYNVYVDGIIVDVINLNNYFEQFTGKLYIPNKNMYVQLEYGEKDNFSVQIKAMKNNYRIDSISSHYKEIVISDTYNKTLNKDYTTRKRDSIVFSLDNNGQLKYDSTIKVIESTNYFTLVKDSTLELNFQITVLNEAITNYSIRIYSDCNFYDIIIIRGELDVEPPPQLRSGFGTLALLGNLNAANNVSFNGFNSGLGILAFLGRNSAFRLTYGIDRMNSNKPSNDIESRYNSSYFASVSYRQNFFNQENLSGYFSLQAMYQKSSIGYEYIDKYKVSTEQDVKSLSLSIGAEFFPFHNLSIAGEYFFPYSILQKKSKIGRNIFRENNKLNTIQYGTKPNLSLIIAFYFN